MLDFVKARLNMVDSQVRTNRVTDTQLIEAMETIPREAFVPESLKDVAYIDEDLDLGQGRSLVESMVFARMVQTLLPLENAEVLHIACGMGYGSAVIGKLSKSVVAVDTVTEFVSAAEKSALDNNIENVAFQTVESLKGGVPELSPFDAIFIEGALPSIPTELAAQLRDGGRLVALIADKSDSGSGQSRGAVTLFTKSEGILSGRPVFDAACPALPEFIQAPTFSF